MPEGSELRVYTDGGARGNPGPAAIGIVVCDASDHVLREHREYIGEGTNNEAEYRAVVCALEVVRSFSPNEILFVSDSELLVRQLNGLYRVRNPRIAELFAEVKRKARSFRKVSFAHRPRLTGHLERADALVNEALDGAGF